jgi:hypothetical protein
MSDREHPEGHEDELGEITPEERAAADALRRDLEARDPPAGSDAAFARGLRVTSKGAPPPEPAVLDRAIEQAMDAHARGRRRRIWGPVLLAAVVLLGIVPAVQYLGREPVAVAPPVAADALFAGPFAEDLPAADRAAAIARARSREYFAARAAGGGR